MIYPTFYKKKILFLLFTVLFIISPIISNAESTLETYKTSDHSILFDFGIHPVGISQTTKAFYICVKDLDDATSHQTPRVKLVTKKYNKKQMIRKKRMNRWNVPDSRSRINMKAWRKKTKKNRAAIHIDAPYVTGKNQKEFQLKDNQCIKNSLLPGTTCQFNVSFQPKKEGKKNANIIIPYTLDGEQDYLTVHVIGSGGQSKQIQTNMASIVTTHVN
ncbi:conserved hypothetical protein, secreted [Candidatus Magnetomorum sp. HK-1]|nr:conserved hypothetical protein, secreted [Candidatus Magnetomorum sp. HK-1]